MCPRVNLTDRKNLIPNTQYYLTHQARKYDNILQIYNVQQYNGLKALVKKEKAIKNIFNNLKVTNKDALLNLNKFVMEQMVK